MAPTLAFYFDFSCPYAYLASCRVKDLADRTGATLLYKPMLLGGIFKSVSTPQTMGQGWSEGKIRHNLLDMHRWAALWGVPLELPSNHPMRTVNALRLILACGEAAPELYGTKLEGAPDLSELDQIFRPIPLTARIFDAYWVKGEDISNPSLLKNLADECGYDGALLLEVSQSPEIKASLVRRTEEALRLGVFGAPSFLVDGTELFWGQDRLHFVEKALQGWRPALGVFESLIQDTILPEV